MSASGGVHKSEFLFGGVGGNKRPFDGGAAAGRSRSPRSREKKDVFREDGRHLPETPDLTPPRPVRRCVQGTWETEI
ncbi:hypothetical protein EYF80_030964 [Liparis tanakae]|uniref:Uncharacterized protein n=1 Tax=Liparis tanakae TaxID=230148 RepID=A0A4Z2H0C6_9TELE|nr:hypothetical protein EYF80_030964 [Liparis tanakae]